MKERSVATLAVLASLPAAVAWVAAPPSISRTLTSRRPGFTSKSFISEGVALRPKLSTWRKQDLFAVIEEERVTTAPRAPPPKPGIPYEKLTVGVVSESWPGEKRVAQSPDTVKTLTAAGFRVAVERGAGIGAGFRDEAYEAAGAVVGDAAAAWAADIVVKVRPPTAEEVTRVECRTLVSLLYPAQRPELLEALRSQGATALALDCIPRTLSRGQTFDVLSSQANIAGYRAVVEAAHAFGRFLGGQMTAAGKVPPARVLVVGAGVAGLAAIAQAKAMGAVVNAFDVRPVAREQVESLGAQFLEVDFSEDGSAAGGYAKQMSPEWHAAAARLFKRESKESDIIITTALIPGKPAPEMITMDMLKSMKTGSVTVDLAAEAGGNVAATVADEVVTTPEGVVCIGYTDLPSRLPHTSSALFANNVAKLILSTGPQTTREKGRWFLDHEDGITRGMLVVEKGRLMWPPPPVAAPASPPPAAAAAVLQEPAEVVAPVDPAEALFQEAVSNAVKGGAVAAAVVAAAALTGGDRSFADLTTVLLLSAIGGSQLVFSVKPALHSPLMAVTNAISGATALGGLVLLGNGGGVNGGLLPATASEAVAAAAVLLSAVNIGGGFAVTRKMLDLFKRPGDPDEHNELLLIPAAALGAAAAAAPALAAAAGGSASALLTAAAEQLPRLTGLTAALACMGSIGGLSSQKTARRGSVLGVAGIGLGLAATAGGMASAGAEPAVFAQAAGLLGVGGAAGLAVASRVGPAELPQTVAAFHSLVGLAATATAAAEFLAHAPEDAGGRLAIFAAAAIGAVTATGSVTAFAKLQGLLSAKPLALPGRDALNLGAAGAIAAAGALMAVSPDAGTAGTGAAAGATVAALLGAHMTASIGGADMPVVITLLNSYSGWALCAEGFMLQNDLLTIVGALIGASGAILTQIMCEAMNRNIASVILGGFGTKSTVAKPSAGSDPGDAPLEHRETNVDAVADLLTSAKDVIIVPGYGLAVAKAQYAVAELARILTEHGVRVRFAIHPVAGRMPGQLNVLLAEAGVPYDVVFELDEINEAFAKADVSLVVGSNDCVNSAAEDDPSSPINGMPVLKVWESDTCVFVKRSMSAGYAGIENPVMYKSKTEMLLGDARHIADSLMGKLQSIYSD